MENTPILEARLLLGDLRVDELEPRVEFTAGGCLVIGDVCAFCLTPDGDLDFTCDGSDS